MDNSVQEYVLLPSKSSKYLYLLTNRDENIYDHISDECSVVCKTIVIQHVKKNGKYWKFGTTPAFLLQ